MYVLRTCDIQEPDIPQSRDLPEYPHEAARCVDSRNLVHGWDSTKELNVDSLLGLNSHNKLK